MPVYDYDWLMLIPLTYQASCKYGANTQWCVASRDTDTHFKYIPLHYDTIL